MKEKYIEDIKEIKEMMHRSGQFISLSGLSGITTGFIALLGASIAYLAIFKGQDYLVYQSVALDGTILGKLLLIAAATLVLSIITAIYFTRRRTKKLKQKIWDKASLQLLVSLSIPLITGGFLCLILLFKGFVGIIVPLTLIFYGLSLINGSKHTLVDIRNLGLAQIFLGLMAMQFVEFGIWFWAFGFGVIQIIYGLMVEKKYK